MEEPVTLRNRSGNRLFGILHIPESGKGPGQRVGVHILNPGLKNRVAPNRLNVKIARMLCEMGFPVLRSDPHGIGDSEGELAEENESVLELWARIQGGALVEDTLEWNTFFWGRAGLEKLLLVGQCGAGVTALLCAGRDRRIGGLALIDTPFRIVPAAADVQRIASEYNEPREIVMEGIGNLFRTDKLRKLITLQFNWHLYATSLVASLRERLFGRKASPALNINERFNWPMCESFKKVMNREVRTCFLYAENDFSLKEFSQDFQPNFLDGNEAYRRLCRIHVIPNANHIYTETSWQEELFERMSQWALSWQQGKTK